MVLEDIILRKEAKHRRMSTCSMNNLPEQSGNWNGLPSVAMITPWPDAMLGGKDFPSSMLQSILEGNQGTQHYSRVCLHWHSPACSSRLVWGWRCEIIWLHTHNPMELSWDCIAELQLVFPTEGPHIFDLYYQNDTENEMRKQTITSSHSKVVAMLPLILLPG